MAERIVMSQKIELSVLFDTVSIEVVCSSDYEAQVLFDDLADRLQRGETVSIGKVASPSVPSPPAGEGGGEAAG